MQKIVETRSSLSNTILAQSCVTPLPEYILYAGGVTLVYLIVLLWELLVSTICDRVRENQPYYVGEINFEIPAFIATFGILY